jgi:hypothetical protein
MSSADIFASYIKQQCAMICISSYHHVVSLVFNHIKIITPAIDGQDLSHTHVSLIIMVNSDHCHMCPLAVSGPHELGATQFDLSMCFSFSQGTTCKNIWGISIQSSKINIFCECCSSFWTLINSAN